MKRIWMSVPHMSGHELDYVREAFETNWLSTVGPNLNAFEAEFSSHIGLPAVALSSGTAAMHLGLRLLGVGPGDTVIAPTLTFVATVNPIRYLGAEPILVDSERESWNMDPALLHQTLAGLASRNALPKAVVVVHLYGQSTDMDPILESCAQYGIPVLEDAAEAIGTQYRGKPAGSLGDVSAFSFNGNKLITTTGGGMLVAQKKEWVDRARFWATQARDPGIAYEHSEIGHNYRMSNVLAGIGRGQLQVVEKRVEQRCAVAFRYRDGFADIPGFSLAPQAPWGRHTNWLSCFLIDPKRSPISRDQLIATLAAHQIESRPVWKPMHLQPLYQGVPCVGGAVAEELFRIGICLPSSSSLPEEDQARIIDLVREACGATPART